MRTAPMAMLSERVWTDGATGHRTLIAAAMGARSSAPAKDRMLSPKPADGSEPEMSDGKTVMSHDDNVDGQAPR